MRFRIKKFQILSDVETNFSQHVRFQIKFFTTRQILKQNCQNVSGFKSKILQQVRFCLKILFLKSGFAQNVHSKNHVSIELIP